MITGSRVIRIHVGREGDAIVGHLSSRDSNLGAPLSGDLSRELGRRNQYEAKVRFMYRDGQPVFESELDPAGRLLHRSNLASPLQAVALVEGMITSKEASVFEMAPGALEAVSKKALLSDPAATAILERFRRDLEKR